MSRIALEDLRRGWFLAAFSLLGVGILAFAFLLLEALSQSVHQFGDQAELRQNLILLEHGVLQPEESRMPVELIQRVRSALGPEAARVDPVIFRIMRVQDHVIQLRGVDPAAWAPSFGLQLVEGDWPAADGEIMLGELATHGTGWGTGSRITIYGTEFGVAGVVKGGGTQALTVWMPYRAAERLFGSEKGAQLLVANLDRSADPVAAQQALIESLGPGGGYDVYFEDSLVRQFGSALDDLRGLSVLTAVIGVAAVTLGAYNLAWLAAERRRHWLGILRSLGFGHRAVAWYLIVRALLISAAGFALAILGALVFFQIALGDGGLMIGGAQSDIGLSIRTALGGLFLTGAATMAGTWWSAREVLATPPAELLGRGPGGY